MSSQQNVIIPIASLYVGDLHPDVTEALLYEKFNPVGQVVSIRICRDTLTKRSLGYGYVNFALQSEAERALDTMNFDFLKGKPMRLMWTQKDPSLRKSGEGNVFIKNLQKNIDNKAIYDTFSAFGNILSCKVALDSDGYSKGYGFVHFDNIESANKAIEKVNGMLLNDKKVYVGKFLSKMEREKHLGIRNKQFTNIYVKNFDEHLTDDQFFDLFKPFGHITSSIIMRHPNGESKCFGFVAYEDTKSAENAVNEMNGKELNGRPLYVGRAQKKGERMHELQKKYEQLKQERYNRFQGTNLFIKNLDDSIDDEDLRKEFGNFGQITSAKVMRLENGRSKGFGFVCFNAADEAQKAITEMNGHVLGTKPLYVALAQRKEDRRAFLSNQFFQRLRQAVHFSPNSPPFIFPNVQAPRFFNHLTPIQSHIRTQPRWGPNPSTMRNGTILTPIMAQYRQNTVRQQVQSNNIRNSMHARPITGSQQGPTSRPNSKYTTNSPTFVRQQIGGGNGAMNGGDSLQQNRSTTTTTTSNSQTQKDIIGERLFRVVEKLYPDMAGKITGMLLEIDNTELIQMIENQDSLKRRVEEAIAVLQAHQAQTAGLVIQD